MARSHQYRTSLLWTGNLGQGTSDYRAYSRNHEITAEGKPTLPGTSDPAFRGDVSRYTPEDLLVSSLSSCHMLWYLHLCAVKGVIVIDYTDQAYGEMLENPDGSGQFVQVTLHPRVVVSQSSMIRLATSLHHDANRMCFIARSVNFPVHHKPEVTCYEKA
jgi:organic hydroperoxide reductase OsmC/OhrA